ncbi:SDR family NAD(P)-dependent oxidoreductase [Rhodococcus sp. T2V]|uniref:SDR family NAD(P)-dependent oxidoreductase n=1 Tax=Rhodococcus sp. T2V TaxID=3034164 RepID=UPI0023E26487|nr:SDR family NAD(P)-dependent oxidoreductase [Rhodococcus sp. T2V]MDF3308142.1 SDR family NAD(P)-dependent oxidoreductase [Rhodococcus sp. T2V]
MGALESRRAMVVGGASGIGRAIAQAFVTEGASVVIADRNEILAKQSAADIGATSSVGMDVTDEESVATGCDAARRTLGGIDVLVNSAGILEQAPLCEMSLNEWRRTIEIDLTGVFLVCRGVVPHMVQARSGRVINIASQLAIKGGVELSHYAAAKAGVIAFTKSLALEVSKDNVLVNAIAPGPIETPLVGRVSEEWKRAKCAELPLGRFGLPEEVAPTAVLLASDPGGNLYVGQTVGPNSGDVMP